MRTRSRTVALTILGAAAFTVAGCRDEQVEAQAFPDLASCQAAAVNGGLVTADQCSQAFAEAEALHVEAAPRYDSLAVCEEQHGAGNCGSEDQQVSQGGSGSIFMPLLAGYLIGSMLGRAGGGMAASQPMYRNAQGGFHQRRRHHQFRQQCRACVDVVAELHAARDDRGTGADDAGHGRVARRVRRVQRGAQHRRLRPGRRVRDRRTTGIRCGTGQPRSAGSPWAGRQDPTHPCRNQIAARAFALSSPTMPSARQEIRMKALTPLAALLIGLGGAAGAQDITVSSKIDTEGGLLGNMILLALQDAGLPVQDRLQLGGTPIMRDAITSGQIDIYPEYTANGAFFFNEADSDVWKDAEAGYKRVAELDLEQNDIVWLQPSPANNTWAIAPAPGSSRPKRPADHDPDGRMDRGGGDVCWRHRPNS